VQLLTEGLLYIKQNWIARRHRPELRTVTGNCTCFRVPVIPFLIAFLCRKLRNLYNKSLWRWLIICPFLAGLRIRPESRNYRILNVASQLLFNCRRKFNSPVPTKIAWTHDDRNHSDFHPGMAALGFELGLPCYRMKQRGLESTWGKRRRVNWHIVNWVTL
jgi:hypothetical protein